MTIHCEIFYLGAKITVSLLSLMVILIPLQMLASNVRIAVRLFLKLSFIRLLQGDRLICYSKTEITYILSLASLTKTLLQIQLRTGIIRS